MKRWLMLIQCLRGITATRSRSIFTERIGVSSFFRLSRIGVSSFFRLSAPMPDSLDRPSQQKNELTSFTPANFLGMTDPERRMLDLRDMLSEAAA